MRRNNKTMISVICTAILIVAVSCFGYQYYQNYKADKVYSVDETVSFQDFNIKITKSEFKKVDLPIDKREVDKYGGLDKKEDCSKLSDVLRNKGSIEGPISSPARIIPIDPSDRTYCIWRNSSRDDIKKYINENKQLVVDYEIMTKKNVKTSNIKIELIADSGRKLNEQVNAFNDNQFMERNDYDETFKSVFVKYAPYKESDIGGDINKGLERKGYIYTDIRNSERIIDIKVTYKNGKIQTRLIRIS